MPLPYVIYLLRLWMDGEDAATWRFSLEDPRTGARRGFASLDDLMAFLQQETAGAAVRRETSS
ncbi:MAG: hypothetical protein KC425_15470 [Anaerolineales bacterium]|nr:hypothetical protein [Anaerolineales bacterium]